MPRFIVRFMKEVLGEMGQTSQVCQTTVGLDSKDEREAEQKAEERFCEIHGTDDWSLHADRKKVDPAASLPDHDREPLEKPACRKQSNSERPPA